MKVLNSKYIKQREYLDKKYWIEKASHVELFSIILFIYNLRTCETKLFLRVADCSEGHEFSPSLFAYPFAMCLCSCSFQEAESISPLLGLWLGHVTYFGPWDISEHDTIRGLKIFLRNAICSLIALGTYHHHVNKSGLAWWLIRHMWLRIPADTSSDRWVRPSWTYCPSQDTLWLQVRWPSRERWRLSKELPR